MSERRDDLAGERTRTVNRLHALLRDLIPGGRQAQPVRRPGRRAAARSASGDRRRRPAQAAVPRVGGRSAATGRRAGAQQRGHRRRGHRRGHERDPDPRGRAGAGREDHRTHRRGRALPDPTPLRQLLRHRADRGLQRRAAPPPALPSREPSAQPGRCTWSRSARSAPAARAESSTSANSPKRRPRRRPGGRSNAGSATPSTATSSEIIKLAT